MTTVRTLASRRNAAFAAVAPAPRALWIARGLALAAAAGLWISPATAQTAAGPVGRIEGDDISVRGEVQVAHENGRSYTSLESGSQVTAIRKVMRRPRFQ